MRAETKTAMTAAQASGDHWGLAAKACLERLGPLPEGANLGVVYVTEAFADDLSSIVTFLRETTPIDDWLGGVGYAVFGPEGEMREGKAMAVLAARVPPGAVRRFESFEPLERDSFLAEHGDWLSRQGAITALVHGNPQEAQVAEMVAGLSETAQAFLIGGLTATGDTPMQVCGRVGAAGLSGALFGEEIRLATALSQGCTPIGGLHRANEVVDNVIMALDGRPALEVLKREAGDIIARDLQKAAGYIHIALPVAGSDNHDYVVRPLLGIDPKRGWLAVGEHLVSGDTVMFVRRDANAAQKDFRRMLAGLAKRLTGETIVGGIYVSCVARGAHMFGRDGRELEMIREALGEFPLVGFSASGEICYDRLYGFTGVLALFL